MNYVRAARNWGQVAVRAMGYGTVSCTLGAVTPGPGVSQWAMYHWAGGSAKGLRIRRSLVHGDRLDTTPQAVIVSNHLSLLDILVLGSYLKRDYRWVAKDSVFKVPFLGWHLRLAGHIPVYRKDKSRNAELPVRVHQAVVDGASLLFFPEGTRSRDGRLQAFKPGAFRTAVDESLPILPLVVRGTGDLMEKHARDLAIDSTRECSVTVLPIIAVPPGRDDDRKARAELLRDQTHAAFKAELGET